MSAADKARALIARGGDSHLPTNAETRLVLSELLDELERLAVGRATLEDQTNRAELAEARAAALEAALREIAEDELNSSRIRAVARAVLVLSGGSE